MMVGLVPSEGVRRFIVTGDGRKRGEMKYSESEHSQARDHLKE